MAKVTRRKFDAGGSESEFEHPKSTKKGAASKNTKERDASEEQKNEEDGGSDDEGDGEEYEIEAILEARHDSFPEGRTSYLIKWKGYDEEHNSWVDENDAQNASELICEFWKNSKKGAPRAATQEPEAEAAAPPAKKRGRHSKASARSPTEELKQEEEDVHNKRLRTKKRGRQSKAPAHSPSEELKQEEEDVPMKKPRKGSKAAESASAKRAAAGLADRDHRARTYIDIVEWKNLTSWEPLVECIDTVERMENNELFVYFTLKHNLGFARENAEVCKRKIPHMMLDFYESNLRWKPSDENAMEE